MKIIGYLIFSLFYYISCICPVRHNRVFCIMTHDSSKDSNVSVVVEYLKKLNETYDFYYIKKSETNAIKNKRSIKNLISFFVVKPYEMATSEFILQDNIFLPIAYIHFRKKVKVIQLWHGTGTLKKFGQSVNVGQLKKLEKNSNKAITHLIVNSAATKSIYAKAFAVDESKVFELGLPRTDILFDSIRLNKDCQQFFGEYPNLKNKKVILYAPTFRDKESNNPNLNLDIELLLESLTKDYVLVLKLHPFVAHKFHLEDSFKQMYQDRLFDLSGYNDINTLLKVSDLLITDYSSVIFDYCILGKPMLFFAYDLEEFSESGRGFYYNYEEYVPGSVAYTTQQLIDFIYRDEFDLERILTFKNENYKYLDGKATKRIVDQIFLDDVV